jgi:hypothetical protein
MHWIRGWVDPRTSLDIVDKRKSCPCQDSNPGYPACSPELSWSWLIFHTVLNCKQGTARVFSRDSPWKVAQWTGRPIRASWGVLWLVIRLLSVRADVSSSVRSILPCTECLYCIPLHTCQHAGTVPATTNTFPTPRRRTVRTKYYYCTSLKADGKPLRLHNIVSQKIVLFITTAVRTSNPMRYLHVWKNGLHAKNCITLLINV